MDLQGWLDKFGHEIKLIGKANYQLTHLHQLNQQFGFCKLDCPVITVAGTNGKGSTVNLIESIVCHEGIDVGVFTSPHIQRFNERIRVKGQCVSDAKLCDAFRLIDEKASLLGLSLSYFEYAFLAACEIFKKAACELVVLEVGLGGRLDATNVIDTDCAIITSIGLDHTQVLGDTRELIATEKAGIARHNVPLIVGELDRPYTIDETAAHVGAILCANGCDFFIEENESHWTLQSELVNFSQLPKTQYGLTNAACALIALATVAVPPVTRAAIEQGLRTACVPGRWQTLPGFACEVVVSVNHNPAAAQYMKQQHLAGEQKRTVALLAMNADKSIADFVATLDDAVAEWVVTEFCSVNARGATTVQMQENFAKRCIKNARFQPDFSLACQEALAAAGPNDRVLVVGSFITVAEFANNYNINLIELGPSRPLETAES